MEGEMGVIWGREEEKIIWPMKFGEKRWRKEVMGI